MLTMARKKISSESRYARVRLVFAPYEDESPKDSLVRVHIRATDGEALRIKSEPFNFDAEGRNWRYFHAIPGETEWSLEFSIPEGTVDIELSVANWANKNNEKGGLEDRVQYGAIDESLTRFNSDMSNVSEVTPREVDDFFWRRDVHPGKSFTLEWETLSGPGRSLFVVKYLDSEGEELLPAEDLPVHPRYGTYFYVQEEGGEKHSKGGIEKRRRELTAPPEAKEISIHGIRWGDKPSKLVSNITLEVSGGSSFSLQDAKDSWVRELEVNDRILVLYTTAGPLDPKNKLLLRTNRLAMECADNGWKVLLVPFSRVNSTLESHRPHTNILQISTEDLPVVIDEVLQKEISGSRVFICSSRTDLLALGLQNRLQDYGWKTVYETRDDMEEFRRVGYSKWYRPGLELRYARTADALIATAPRLKERISTIAGRDDIERIPNAGPDSLFKMCADMRTVDNFLEHRSTPIVGYLGHMTSAWFDWQYLVAAAASLREITFEIIGPGVPEDIYLPSNVVVYGQLSHEDSIEIVKRWRVGLIPFIESRLTYGVDPNKAYEYVAMGLRTVSAPMGDVEQFPGVHIYRSEEEFVDSIRSAAKTPPSIEFYSSCNQFLIENSWSYRGRQFGDFLEVLTK